VSKPLLSRLPFHLAFPAASRDYNPTQDFLFSLGRCLGSKSSHLLRAFCQEVGYYQMDTTTHRLRLRIRFLRSRRSFPRQSAYLLTQLRQRNPTQLRGEEHEPRPSTTDQLGQHLVLLHTYAESDTVYKKLSAHVHIHNF